MEYAVVRGWRAYFCTVCSEHFAEHVWCLCGMLRKHLHEIPPPKAGCIRLPSRQDWQKDVDLHTLGPVLDCSCGFYGLFQPSLIDAAGFFGRPVVPVVWAEITALGTTVVHDRGFRCESYQVSRLFWPALDKDQIEPMPDDYEVAACSDSDDEYESYTWFREPLAAILPGIANGLNVELVRRPVGLWRLEQQSIEDLIHSSSMVLEGL